MLVSERQQLRLVAVAGDGYVVVDGAAGGRVAEFGARDDVLLRQLRDEHAAFCGEGNDGKGRGLAVVVTPHFGPGSEVAFPVFRIRSQFALPVLCYFGVFDAPFGSRQDQVLHVFVPDEMQEHPQILHHGTRHAYFVDGMNVNHPGETNLGALEREAFVEIGKAGCDRLEDIGVASLGVIEAGGVYEESVGVWDGVDLHFWGTFFFRGGQYLLCRTTDICCSRRLLRRGGGRSYMKEDHRLSRHPDPSLF